VGLSSALTSTEQLNKHEKITKTFTTLCTRSRICLINFEETLAIDNQGVIKNTDPSFKEVSSRSSIKNFGEKKMMSDSD
jgi:hypothetical protein